MAFEFPIVSADSHITEPPDCYSAYIEPAYREQAPHMVDDPKRGDVFVIPGMRSSIPMGLVAAAGVPSEELTQEGKKFDAVHRSGYDSSLRLADQDRDGVAAEILYPTVGMVMCNHPDADYKDACFTAYNRWLSDYCSTDPNRLLGCGQTALLSVEQGIADLEAIKAAGLRGVMMPGAPGIEQDYDDPVWDPFWQAAIDLGLPLGFHILTAKGQGWRGPKLNSFISIIRAVQDIMGTFVFGGVFERNPDLRIVCVEADAGWAPHYMYRMDHAYKRHRNWLQPGVSLARLPSEYFADHIYMTFQDDWTAFAQAGNMNWRRLMWANDFPHSDSTWPWSQEMLAEQTQQLEPDQIKAILSENAAELYKIDLARLTPALA